MKKFLLVLLACCFLSSPALAASPPTVTGQSVTTNQNYPISLGLWASNAASATLTFTVSQKPAHGEVALAGGGACSSYGVGCFIMATYSPAVGFAGTDGFQYTVSDGSLTSSPAQVGLNVLPGPVNPISSSVTSGPPSQVTTGTGVPVTVTLRDAYGNPVSGKTVRLTEPSGSPTATITTPGSSGNLSDANGQASFTVTDNTAGVDTFLPVDTSDGLILAQTTNVTFLAGPSVSTLAPSVGAAAGGTEVTITGTGFTGATAVTFGGTPATAFRVNSDTSITASAPPGTSEVNVTVTAGGVSSTINPFDQFTYAQIPSVGGLFPSSGPASGGTLVTISGGSFKGTTAVSFGGNSAGFKVDPSGTLTATSPPGTGTVDVEVTTPGGTSPVASGDQFTYTPAPSITNLVPMTGPSSGGTVVFMTGTGFTGTTAVHFGATPAQSFSVTSPSSLTATSPSGTGNVDVTVTASGGTSASGNGDKFTYIAPPVVASLTPASGPTAGGTLVTIKGSGFLVANAVYFGPSPATFTVSSDTYINATAPAGAGVVDITVVTPDGTSSLTAADHFTYIGPGDLLTGDVPQILVNTGLGVQTLATVMGQSPTVYTQVFTADGNPSPLQVPVDVQGNYDVSALPLGSYTLYFTLGGPDGKTLAGTSVQVKLGPDIKTTPTAFIDPMGTVTDANTGQPLQGVTVELYWANTPRNLQENLIPESLATLSPLPNLSPGLNSASQVTGPDGQYGWLVPAGADYYLTAWKNGYQFYDSRLEGRSAPAAPGADTALNKGIFNVGSVGFKYNFVMQSKAGQRNAYILGYPDGNFAPNLAVTRAQAAVILGRIKGITTPATTSPYADVPLPYWASGAIETVKSLGLMQGDSMGDFRPDTPITRAEVAAIIARYDNLNPSPDNSFSDTAGNWAAGFITTVAQSGLMQGYPGGAFHPAAPITRAEFVTVINRLVGRGPLVGRAQLWPDVPPSYWAFGQIQEASVSHTYTLQADGSELWGVDTVR